MMSVAKALTPMRSGIRLSGTGRWCANGSRWLSWSMTADVISRPPLSGGSTESVRPGRAVLAAGEQSPHVSLKGRRGEAVRLGELLHRDRRVPARVGGG